MITFTAYEAARIILIMLAIGTIAGVPIGHWLAHLPVPGPPPAPDGDIEQLADTLTRAAGLAVALAEDARDPSPPPQEPDQP